MVRLNSTVENDCLTDEVTIRKKMGPQSKMVPQSTWLVKSGMRTRAHIEAHMTKRSTARKKTFACVNSRLDEREIHLQPLHSKRRMSHLNVSPFASLTKTRTLTPMTMPLHERTENVKPADFAADRAGSRNIPVHDRRRRDSKVCVERKTVVRSRFASANVEASASVWRRPNRRKEKWAGRKYLHATLHRPREFAGRMTS